MNDILGYQNRKVVITGAASGMGQAAGQMPDEAIDLFLPANGRYATGAETGEPLVVLNSRLASFVSGINLPVDYGYSAEVFMGQRDDLLGIA